MLGLSSLLRVLALTMIDVETDSESNEEGAEGG